MLDWQTSAEILGGLAAVVGVSGVFVWVRGRRRHRGNREEQRMMRSRSADRLEAKGRAPRSSDSWHEEFEAEEVSAEEADYAASAGAGAGAGAERILYESSADLPDLEFEEAPAEPAKPHRFANVVLTDLDGRKPVRVPVGASVLIEVDIGQLRQDSDVVDPAPVPFPDHLLPDEDLEITVLLSSATLDVGSGPERGRAAEAALVLPRDGGPSRRAEGEGPLRFEVTLPEELTISRARLSYLYRDTVVQSQRLDLLVAPDKDACIAFLTATTDFSISSHLDGQIQGIADRPRVAIVPNKNPGGVHEVTVRPPAGAPAPPVAFQINEDALGRLTEQMREAFSLRAATKIKRSSGELRKDLESLAPIGWQVFSQINVNARRAITAVDGGIVQVALPSGSGFSLPWQLVYDIFIDSTTKPSQIPICPIVDELANGYSFAPGTHTCPHASTVSHVKNLLCPFGFWGFRFSFELLASTRSPVSEIEPGAPPTATLARTEVGVDRRLLRDHLQRLGVTFAEWSSGSKVQDARTKEEVREGLCADLPFVYFLCHGEHSESGSTVLSVGEKEAIEPADFEGWVETVYRDQDHALWSSPRPLVFINACESLAIAPDDLVGYLGAFIGTAQAAGVIGTETRVNQQIAMDVGERFFRSLLISGATVEEALSEIKLNLLASANLAGLNYTPYCFADLRVGKPAAAVAAP